jgi:hypothetical protein
MTSAEKLARAAADRLRSAAPFGIPPETLSRYDLGRGIAGALTSQDGAGGFEGEVSQEVERHLLERGVRLQGGPHSIVVPGHAFFGSLTTGTPEGGQEWVRPGLSAPGVASPARPVPRVRELGATVVSEPGDLRLVRLDDGLPLQWLPTDALADEFDLAELSTGAETALMRTGATGTLFSRQLSAQSSLVPLLRRDVDQAVADLVDQGAIRGSGEDGEPLGLFARDMAITALGVDGGPLTWEALTSMEERAHEDASRPGWLTTAGVRRQLRRTPEVGEGGGPVWRGGPAPGFVLGAPAFASGHVPTDLEKGGRDDLHGIVYASDWSQLLVNLAGVEVVLDPYTLGGRGWVVARVFVYAGVAVWRGEVFVRCSEVVVPSEGGS